MTFLSDRCRPKRLLRAPLAALAALAASAALLVACGGGTSQVQAFKPDRLLVFGDEASVIVNGRKYSINDETAVVSATVAWCQALPTVAQSMANLYGFAFQECNPAAATPKAFILARVDARVDDPALGLARQIAAVSGGLGSTDLAMVMIGANDVIALWEQVRGGGMTNNQAVAEAQRLGGVAAAQVNALLETGARAVVVTIPDMGLSPYAIAQEAASPGAVALISSLSYQYNAYLRTRIDATAYDGRNYGLVLADDIVSAMVRLPAAYLGAPSVANVAACTTSSAKDCRTYLDPSDSTVTLNTLVSGATTSSHLWADDRHLGPSAHSRIAQSAQARALNNPF